MRYDWARASLDRHATDIVAAYVAGAALDLASQIIPPGRPVRGQTKALPGGQQAPPMP
jgi:hypothetical protein